MTVCIDCGAAAETFNEAPLCLDCSVRNNLRNAEIELHAAYELLAQVLGKMKDLDTNPESLHTLERANAGFAEALARYNKARR